MPYQSEFRPEEHAKKCPDCAESIKLEARVCRFCGYKFEAVEAQAAIQQAKSDFEKKKGSFAREKLSRGLCPNCDAYNAWDWQKGFQRCGVCGEQYPLVIDAPDQPSPVSGSTREPIDNSSRHQFSTDQPLVIKNPYRGKNKQIWGALLLFFALIGSCGAGFNLFPSSVLWTAILLALVGAILYLSGRFEHWYHAE